MDWREYYIQDFLQKVLNGLGILFLLNLLYFVSFKLIKWKSNLLKVTLRRIRLPAYLLMTILILTVFAGFFPAHGLIPLVFKLLDVMVILLTGILIIEVLNAGFFDYFIPKIGKQDTLPIYRQLLVALAYLFLVYGILGWLLHIDFSHLLTTSAIVSVVLGLALQDTLGNLFSGLALNVSRPYQVGDWVKFGDYEGKVISIDWRAVIIFTTADTVVSMPNSILAKMPILNYSSPTPVHVRTLTVGVDYRHSPDEVRKALLEILGSTPGVLADPPPRVRLIDYSDYKITYRLVFWIDEFGNFPQISTDILEKIWYKFRRESIIIPYPVQSIIIQKQEEGTKSENKVSLLKTIDFLQSLDEQELEYIAGRLKIHIFRNGERICEQKEPGDTFYVVKKGKVCVSAVNENNEKYLEKELSEGSFFGEISLLTGEPRSATVTACNDVELFTIGKEDLRHLIKSNPRVGEVISRALAKRQQFSLDEMSKVSDTGDESEESFTQKAERLSAEEFLRKISYFFSY